MKRWLGLFFLLVMISGCGTVVTVDKAPSPGLVDPAGKKVLILPLPTYEPLSPQAWLALNANLYEELADGFHLRGFWPLSYESSLALLEAEGVLEVRRSGRKVHESLRLILEDPEWSPLMRQEVWREIQKETAPRVSVDLRRWSAFSEEKLLAMARKKGVDLLVCGRLARYRLRPEETLNPFQIGFLTFATRVPARFLFGAPQPGFGPWHEVAMGAFYGGLIGANAQDPFEPPVYKPATDSGHPLFTSSVKKVSGDSHYETGNTIVWGLIGAGTAWLASKGSYAPEAALTLSLEVYEVSSGRKIWMSRTKLRVSPESVFAPHGEDKLLEKAVEEAVSRLMARFWEDWPLATKLAAIN